MAIAGQTVQTAGGDSVTYTKPNSHAQRYNTSFRSIAFRTKPLIVKPAKNKAGSEKGKRFHRQHPTKPAHYKLLICPNAATLWVDRISRYNLEITSNINRQ